MSIAWGRTEAAGINLERAGGRVDIKGMLHERRAEIERIANKHGACNVRVFGSISRGDAGPESDIDLLVDAGPNLSSWFPAGLILELQALLGREVDVVTEPSLNAHLRERVLREAMPF